MESMRTLVRMETSENPKRPPDAATKSATFSEAPSGALDPELDRPEQALAEGPAFPAVFGQQEAPSLGLAREHDGPLAPGHGAVGRLHTLRLARAFHLWDALGDLGAVATLLGHRGPDGRGSTSPPPPASQ